jgi:hypothetical protein
MLTTEQINTFQRDGVVVLRGFIPPAEIGGWREQIVEWFGRPVDRNEWRAALASRRPDDFHLLPDPVPGVHPGITRLYQALHSTAPWTGHNQLIVRPGNDPAALEGPRLAHVDIPLSGRLRTLANFVLYLSTVHESGGAFIYWPGSHRVTWDYFTYAPADYMAAGELSHNQVFERLLERATSGPVTFTGEPGDLLVWHALTIHSASVNKRPEERLALFGRWGVPLGSGQEHDFGGDMWRDWSFKPAP